MQQRIITAPVRLTGAVHPRQLASLISIDAMVRRGSELGESPVAWELTTLAGDVAMQRAVQRAVAREGDDRDELGRDGLAARAKKLEIDAGADLRRLLDQLKISADLDRWASDSGEAASAARVAFVRLYETGAISRTDAVLDGCPSCETVVDDADADSVEMEVDQIRLSLPLVDGTLEIDVAEPEMLVGAVAVAVPAESKFTDQVVVLPLTENEVPIVAVEGLAAPVVVVPGHDSWSHDLARQLGYPVIQVLDADAVVRHPGPLEGLGRYAARAAATEQLAAEGFVTAHFEAVQTVKRCYRCSTVLVPLLGSHWILALGDLISPLLEQLDAGAIEFFPGIAVDYLREAAERAGSWCVSQQLWSGQPIPVSTCLDCAQTSVSVDDSLSCGSCFGTLQPEVDVLDARFVAVVTPLAMIGWPDQLEDPASFFTTLSVGRAGLDTWALPMALLGLRLAGVIPFSRVVLHQSGGADEPGRRSTADVIALAEASGVRVTRVALLEGDYEVEHAAETVAVLDDPNVGSGELDGRIGDYELAISMLDGAAALSVLVDAARRGLAPSVNAKLAELARPLLGD